MLTKRRLTPSWYTTDGDVWGQMHDGTWGRFVSDTEYVEEFREEEKKCDIL